MSSSEESDAGPKRKRKLRSIEDSPASTSSGSPVIKSCSALKKTRIHNVAIAATSDSDFSSSSSGSPILTKRKIRKGKRVVCYLFFKLIFD